MGFVCKIRERGNEASLLGASGKHAADVISTLTPKLGRDATCLIPSLHVVAIAIVVLDMLGRLAGRPPIRQACLAQRAFQTQKHAQYPFNSRIQDALLTRRTFASTCSRKQEGKEASTSETNDGKEKARAKPSFFRRVKTCARWTAYAGASSVVGVLLIGSAIFLHDAFTYTERHVDRVPVNPLALNPEVGGPKKLPVARVLVSDEEDEENKALSSKPRLVIVGGGWGVCSSTLLEYNLKLI